jgi:hypothetical protein
MEKTTKHQPVMTGSVMLDERTFTRETLIDLIRSVAEDDPTVRVTRDRFRAITKLKDSDWIIHFGTFPAFLEAAELETSATTRALSNQIARHSRKDYLRSVSHSRLTWGNVYQKPDNGERFKTMLVASDFHDTETDPFCMRMFVEALQQIQPDVVCVNGDLFDLPEFSKHPKDPREWKLVERIQNGLAILETIRNVCPTATIDLIEGNHEARIIKFMLDNSPQLMEILSDHHDMDVRKLLRLDDYAVNYVATTDLAAFTDAQLLQGVRSSEKIYYNFVRARHHPPSKKDPVLMPGFHGHHHAHLVTTHWAHNLGSFEWHQLGAMHKRLASYTDGRKWNCGFLYAIMDTQYERVMFDYTVVGDTGCQLGGQFYERLPTEYYPKLLSDLNRQY